MSFNRPHRRPRPFRMSLPRWDPWGSLGSLGSLGLSGSEKWRFLPQGLIKKQLFCWEIDSEPMDLGVYPYVSNHFNIGLDPKMGYPKDQQTAPYQNRCHRSLTIYGPVTYWTWWKNCQFSWSLKHNLSWWCFPLFTLNYDTLWCCFHPVPPWKSPDLSSQP
jgi:hypothetical protein